MEARDMRRSRFSILKALLSAAVVLLLIGVGSAQQRRQADIDLQAAIRIETVDGDLNAAIKQYEAIVSKYKSDRAVAVTALVHLADCYQKLGDAKAQRIYEQILREYGDQTEATAVARGRLGSPSSGAGESVARRVWTAPSGAEIGWSRVSPDGRRFTYEMGGDLYVHDTITGADRRVTDVAAEPGGTAGGGGVAAFSRDGNLLAYSWDKSSRDNGWEVRLVDLRSSGVPKFHTLVDNGAFISPDAFSPDGKSIAGYVGHGDNRTAHIGLLSVADGSVRLLKAIPGIFSANPQFSPDGRYLAYDFHDHEARVESDIHVISVDGTSDVPAVVNPSQDHVLGWSQDGKQLIFASDRTGTRGLWSLPVSDGKPQGAPKFLREASEDLWPMGLTASTALFSALDRHVNTGIRVGEFDFNTGRFLSAPVDPVVTFIGKNRRPAWSPDGKSLAYLSERSNAEVQGPMLVVRSTDTGALHEFQIKLFIFSELSWSPDGRSLVVLGSDRRRVTGLYRINAQTGEVTLIAARKPEDAASPDWSADGSRLYYRRALPNDEAAFVEYDLASGVEKELIRRSSLGGVWLSPDRRYIATFSRLSGERNSLLLIPTGGGSARELAQVTVGRIRVWAWAPDGNSVFVQKLSGELSGDVLRVPVSGGAPQELGLKTDPESSPLRVSPDGKRVAFQVTEPDARSEVWVMENFLTISSTKK
jgi:Tol biopolymer transport system component